MSIPSNLYAEKVFSEHPLSLWALDDNVEYASIIKSTDMDLSLWTVSGGSIDVSDTPGPISNIPENTIRIVGNGSGYITLTSPIIDSFDNINKSIETLTMSLYVKTETQYIQNVEFGILYNDGSSNVYLSAKEQISLTQTWGLVSKTFDTPTASSDFRILVKIRYQANGGAGAEYAFGINGITLGQLSEEFYASSFGQQPELIQSSIAMPDSSYGIKAYPYGLQNNYGYYLLKDGLLLAKNFGIPMVYGSSTVTTLYPNDANPSVIIPSLGFMNHHGKNKNMTLEFWMKINSGSASPIRIVGPISSNDGIYVSSSSLTLKLNDKTKSYYVGEWGRPMLINLSITEKYSTVMINGEEVIRIDLSTTDIVFPNQYSETGKDQDWIGFYANENISPVQIDCVAIYPYEVPAVVAKRRFVYGQGVDLPENISSSYNTSSVVIDYPLANYANNYSYPSTIKWETGISDNVYIANNMLSIPEYEIPEIVFNNKTLQSWKYDNDIANVDQQNNFISLKPNTEWANTDGYLKFSSFEKIDKSIEAMYGIFQRRVDSDQKQTLIKLVNQYTDSYLEISISGDIVSYVLRHNGNVQTLYTVPGYSENGIFSIGININTLISKFGQSVSSFFGNRKQISVYIGGSDILSNTFDGKIFKVGFCTKNNFEKISTLFNDSGILAVEEEAFYLYGEDIDNAGEYNTDVWAESEDGGLYSSFAYVNLFAHIASYTAYLNSNSFGNKIDLAVDATWQDYVPLSYFAKYATNANNDKEYVLDLMQFNINYPEPNDHISGAYNTYDSPIRTYITFQPLTIKAVQPNSYYEYVEAAPSTGVIYADSNWVKTKYEVVNGMIIYPPAGVNINDLGISIRVEANIKSILDTPINIKSLQLASLALNNISANNIGTKHGIKIKPYSKLGVYMDYKKRNPFSIYKGSSPHLYLTKDRGVRLRGESRVGLSRGISTPINQEKSAKYTVGAIQAFIRYDEELFPEHPVEIFEVQSSQEYIKFYLVAADKTKKRGKLYAINTSTGIIQEDIAFFVNGRLVKDAIINLHEWLVLGIQFSNKLNFNGYAGAFRITGLITADNISHYTYTAEQESKSIRARPWINVLNTDSGSAVWDDWNPEFIWKNVLFVLSTNKVNIDPKDIYDIYTGTKKFIVSDNSKLMLNKYEYRVYKDVTWDSYTQSAV